MGRHSASGDDDVADEIVAPEVLDLALRRGRHSSGGGDADDQRTQMIAVVDAGTDVDERHDTDQFAPVGAAPPAGVLDEVLTETPARPSRADRRAAKQAEKEAKAAQKRADQEPQPPGTAPEQAPDAAVAGPDVVEPQVAEPEVAEPEVAEPEVAEPEVVRPDVAEAAVASAAPAAPADAANRPAKTERRESDTRADMRLLRHNSAVRARCIAAVVVSFVLYTAVMLIIGRAGVYLLWIWIPIVLAGVLVGTVLDMAHRADAAQSTSPPS